MVWVQKQVIKYWLGSFVSFLPNDLNF